MHDDDDDDDNNSGVARDGGHTPNDRLTETCSLALLCTYLTIMLCSINTCQNQVSADQYVIILWAQVNSSWRSHVFLKLAADQVLVFDWIASSCQVNLLKTGPDCSEAG